MGWASQWLPLSGSSLFILCCHHASHPLSPAPHSVGHQGFHQSHLECKPIMPALHLPVAIFGYKNTGTKLWVAMVFLWPAKSGQKGGKMHFFFSLLVLHILIHIFLIPNKCISFSSLIVVVNRSGPEECKRKVWQSSRIAVIIQSSRIGFCFVISSCVFNTCMS